VLDPAFLRVAELAGVAQLGEGLEVFRQPGADGAFALSLGVKLGAEQDSDVGNPQPDQEDDHGGERPHPRLVMCRLTSAGTRQVHRQSTEGA
jgi:hypothetical protein